MINKFIKNSVIAISLLAMASITYSVKAQEVSIDKLKGKNFIKLNVPSILLGSASVQYERLLKNHWSAALGLRLTPGVKIDLSPLLSKEDSILKGAASNVKLNTFAVYGEARYYFKKNAGRGLYLASMLKYNQWKLGFDFNNIDSLANSPINMYGTWQNFSAGLSIGYQFKISKQFYADWWIGGLTFGYGRLGAHLKGANLDFDEEKIKEVNEILQMPDGGILNKSKSYVNKNEISLVSNWNTVFNLRFGFCLGYRF